MSENLQTIETNDMDMQAEENRLVDCLALALATIARQLHAGEQLANKERQQ
jgi:hypothetical protein